MENASDGADHIDLEHNEANWIQSLSVFVSIFQQVRSSLAIVQPIYLAG